MVPSRRHHLVRPLPKDAKDPCQLAETKKSQKHHLGLHGIEAIEARIFLLQDIAGNVCEDAVVVGMSLTVWLRIHVSMQAGGIKSGTCAQSSRRQACPKVPQRSRFGPSKFPKFKLQNLAISIQKDWPQIPWFALGT